MIHDRLEVAPCGAGVAAYLRCSNTTSRKNPCSSIMMSDIASTYVESYHEQELSLSRECLPLVTLASMMKLVEASPAHGLVFGRRCLSLIGCEIPNRAANTRFGRGARRPPITGRHARLRVHVKLVCRLMVAQPDNATRSLVVYLEELYMSHDILLEWQLAKPS